MQLKDFSKCMFKHGLIAWEWACSNLCFRRLGGSEPQEMRVLAKLDILSSQVAAAVCDSQQN